VSPAQVENGDLNWILPGKLLAFSGPAARPTDYVGFRAMVPEDYWEYFRRRGIQAIVRLNKKVGAGVALRSRLMCDGAVVVCFLQGTLSCKGMACAGPVFACLRALWRGTHARRMPSVIIASLRASCMCAS
jgi:hypothetical protein